MSQKKFRFSFTLVGVALHSPDDEPDKTKEFPLGVAEGDTAEEAFQSVAKVFHEWAEAFEQDAKSLA